MEIQKIADQLRRMADVLDEYAPVPAILGGVEVEERLTNAIRFGVAVAFDYAKGDPYPDRRFLAPYELYRAHTTGKTYVRGWDYAREGIRQFVLDKIDYVAPAGLDYRQPLDREVEAC